MNKYTSAQMATIQRFATRLYEVGFLHDEGLLSSRCYCCENKRKLLQELQQALSKDSKKGKKAR